MKPSLLKRHLERNHPNKMNADKSYFQRLADNVKRQRTDKTGQMQQKSKDVVAASYEIALLVAEQKQPHTIAESLILPGAKILVKRVFGEQAIAKLNAVSLSNNTIKRRIEEMSDDIADQVLAEIKESKFGFAIQLDESTDITNYCQLLVYVRYAQTNIMKTELLLNHEVSTTTKGKDIFDILDSFFKKNGLDWKNLVGCTTDGAPSMLACRSGFQSYVKAVSPNVTSVHCFIHRFALCTKVLPTQLLACLKQVVKIINFVKASALNTRFFKQLCEDFGSEHTSLLYHTEVRWLSRRNATKRLFEMKNEMLLLFKELGHPYSKDLENEEFLQRFAYLSDTFEAFNIVNLSLRGRNGTIVDFVSKLGAFIRKLDLWKRNTENNQLGMFKCLSSLKMKCSFSEEIASHLASLKEELEQYFPEAANYEYTTNPFSVNPHDLAVGTDEQEELIDLQEDNEAKIRHRERPAINFWLDFAASYPTLASRAVSQLLTFPSTWECEQGLSTFLNIKSKKRNRLVAPQHDFRCAVSESIKPRIDRLVDNKQSQKSH